MVSFSRRAAIGSLIAAGALTGPAPLAHAMQASSPVTPAGPMRLGRRVTRELRDGETLIVAREWDIAFAPMGRGFSVAGQQVDVVVEAPAVLGALAEIERSRSTEGMFPIMLDQSGMIMTAGSNMDERDFDAAVIEAEKTIAETSGTLSDRNARLMHLAQLQKAGSTMLEQMPRDLFFPDAKSVRTVKPLALADGTTGEFEFTYTAHTAEGGPWLSRAERKIVTRIGDDKRYSSELWTLS